MPVPQRSPTRAYRPTLRQTSDAFAFDRESTRTYDDDGHLHVADNRITKANVCPYRGSEIPGWDKLRLDPNRIYKLLRHPDELAKGAKTFEGKPVLLIHRGSTAADHPRALTVGSVSSPSLFDGEHVRAPLHFWDQEAIEGIESGDQRELSSGYRYDPDMTPGIWNGETYDGVMRNIRGNHVALVKEGRAGPEVHVGDAALPPEFNIIEGVKPMPGARNAPTFSRTAVLASGALRGILATRLAADQKIDLAPILKGVTAKTWKADKVRIIAAVNLATKGKLATDANMDDLPAAMSSVDKPAAVAAKAPAEPAAVMPPAAMTAGSAGAPPDDGDEFDDDTDRSETASKVSQLLEGKLSPEDLAAVMAVLNHESSENMGGGGEGGGGGGGEGGGPPGGGANDDPPFNGRTPVNNKNQPNMVSQQAMDAAIGKARKEAEEATITRLQATAEAQRIVRPVVGDLALDGATNASSVFKLALDQMGVNLKGVPEVAYRAVFEATAKAREEADTARRLHGGAPRVHLAADAKAVEGFTSRFGQMPRRA